MTGLLIITGTILLIALFALVYRILALVNIAKGASEKRVGYSNTVNGFLFIVFFIVGFGAFFWYSAKAQYLPPPSSEHGVVTDNLFWTTTAIITVAFVATHVLLFLAPYFFRFREDRKAHWYPDNTKLELIWTVIPGIVMAILVITGLLEWNKIMAPAPDNATELEIVGKQFNWMVRYPGKDGKIGKYDFTKIDGTNQLGMDFANDKANFDDFTPREIHLPKGKPVKLNIRARDVLHSVYMPHFRVKMDAVPGMPTTFWFTPTKSTADMRKELNNEKFNYEMACTEICGNSHFAMRMVIVVDEPEDFNKWVTEQEPWSKQNKDYISSLKLKDVNLADLEK
ncbi:MAG: cytochrome c oxidase subunit II [Thermoflexibacter sp.]|jgi:cytochrome c oxidase subunit 2|nr:cytochrome c oxidase subunit II [Thermoflexibacter sp.]